MNKTILFRKSIFDEEEFEVAQKYCNVVQHRSECKNSLVVGRYSTLPFYKELETDLHNNSCHLVNTFVEHNWIASFDYYEVVKDFTFPTWNSSCLWKTDYDGPFFVKGVTNSRKHNWNTHAYASTKQEAIKISSQLSQDGLLCNQEIIYRKYEPLKTFEIGLNGLPFANEWRCFFWKNHLLARGFYWTEAQCADQHTVIPKEALEFAQHLANMVQDYATFFVLDVAEKEKGGWVLVEINDGSMSGPSMCDLDTLYKNLRDCN